MGQSISSSSSSDELTPTPGEGGLRLEGGPFELEGGWVARRMYLHVTDATDGGEKLLRTRTARLDRLVLELDLEWAIGRSIEVSQLVVSPEDGAWVVELETPRAEAALRFELAAVGGLDLELRFDVPVIVGGYWDPRPEIRAALDGVLGPAEEIGPGRYRFAPIVRALRTLFPARGWKLPDASALRLVVAHEGAKLRLEAVDREGTKPDPRNPPAVPGWAVVGAAEEGDRALAAAEAAVAEDAGNLPGLAVLAQLATAKTAPEGERRLLALADRLRRGQEHLRTGWVLTRAARIATPERRARHLETAAHLRAEDGRLLGELAEALVPLGRVSAAIRALRRRAALEDDLHERARLHGRAAQLLREEGDAQGALRELDRALRFAPRNPSLLVARADVRTSLGQQEQASKELESALDRTPPHEQEALLVSALRLHAGLEASALDALAERAFASSPVPPAVISALLDSASAVGDETLIYRALSAADAWTEQPGDLPPPRLDLHRHAAALHVAAGRRPEAIAHLRLLTTSPRATGEDLIALERLALDADLPELVEFARSRRVSAALAARRPSEIVDVFRSTIEQADPASDAHQTARRALGEALQRFPADRALLDVALEGARRAKDSAALIELLQTRLQEQEEAPQRAELLAELARAWRSTGRPLAAVRALEEAATLDPDGEWLERIADIHRARDDRTRLAAVLDRLAERAPPSKRAGLLSERGRILAALGEDAAAYGAVQAALAAGETSPMTESLATVLALRLERFEEAARHARGRLEQVPQDAPPELRLPIWVDLARVAEATGDERALDEALAHAVDLAEPETAVGRQLAERRFDELERVGDVRGQAELATRLGGETRLPEPERARWLARSAERWIAVGEPGRAETACEVALGMEGVADEVRDRALAALEAVAREADDAERLASILERRADRLGDDETGQRVRLEQLELLESSGAWNEALAAARRAARLFPDSLMLAARLGGLAERVEAPSEAGAAFARAAALAERTPRPELAVGLHARAARAFVAAGDQSAARHHDEAVLDAARSHSIGSQELIESIERLEAHAHARGDLARRIELLETKARAAEGPEQIAALEGLASLALASGRVDEGLRALEQAVETVESTDAIRAASLEERLDSARSSAGRSRERIPALEKRARGAQGPEAALLWLRAARVLLDDLDDADAALIRVRAAVRADPDHLEARGLRLDLLQQKDASVELVEVLEEEGARATDVSSAAALWREAAETLLELQPEASDLPLETLRRRSAELARRAAAATPRDPGPLRLALRALREVPDVQADELSLLGQLAGRTPHPEERVGCHLRRARLLEDAFHNPRSALAELETLLETPQTIRSSALGAFFPERANPEVAFLEWGAHLSERCDEPEREENFLQRLQSELDLPQRRAEIAGRRARLLAAALADPKGAEAAWREVLTLQPDDSSARSALLEQYASEGRFDDLGDVLGTELLQRAWASLRGDKRLAAGGALLPRLSEGPARAEVMLAHAEDLAGAGASVEEVEALLIEVARQQEGQLSARAWHRLARRYEASGDFAKALRAQLARAAAADETSERADAYAAAAALYVAVGDLAGAERTLDEARALTPEGLSVREATRTVLGAGGRFEELGRELGTEALEEELREALDSAADPAIDGPRLLAMARALASLRPDVSPVFWLDVAARLGELGAHTLETEALEAASASGSEAGEQALDRLAEIAGLRGDLAGRAQALRRRYKRATSAEREARGLEFVDALRAWRLLDGPPEADAEAEEVLLALRAAAPSPRVDAALETLWLDGGQFQRLGEVLGAPRLAEHVDRARSAGETELERGLLRAWARLLEGEDRARVLDRLAENWEQAGLPSPAAEAREGAWQASPTPERADRLGASLVSVGDFTRWARAVGPEPVAAWMAEHPDDERRPRAGEALAAAWQDKGGADGQNLGQLWTEVGEGFLALSDGVSAERAFRSALTADPKQSRARSVLGDLLADEARFEDLAELDLDRLAREADTRREGDDLRGAADALAARADRLSGEGRASVLADVATILARLEGPAAEEMVLRAALEAHPDHDQSRERLGTLMWKRGAHTALVDALGAEALLERFEASAKLTPGRALEQLSRAREALPTELRAIADERAAEVRDPEADPEADLLRRVDALASARFTWDQLGRDDEGARVRLALVDVHAETDPIRYREALQDAWDHVRAPELRARVGLALADLERDRAPGVSREILQAILQNGELSTAERAAAAEQWLRSVDDGEMYEAEVSALALEAHEVLASSEAPDGAVLTRLARLREAAGEAPERVAEPLIAAMKAAPPELQPDLHLRLREVHESAGQYAEAEPHATAWAEHAGRAVDWLSVSELRLWLGDLSGAEAAADRAFALDPELPEVHALRVQLSERTGDERDLAERLLRFAEVDAGAPASVRADRARRAGEAARAAEDTELVLSAVRLGLAVAPSQDTLTLADELLAGPEFAEERLSILREAVDRMDERDGAAVRVRLVSSLEALGRHEEAMTVLGAGLRPGLGGEDPVLAAALDQERSVTDGRLLEWADRLGESAAAQRLRTEAATRAEARGDREVARSAWSRVATSARPSFPETERARSELVRLAREDEDPGALIAVLEELAEDSGDERSAEEAWLEAAEIAEDQLGALERAASLLHRGHRVLGSARLARAFEDLQRRHHRWASLDAWLESQWRDAEGPAARAEWAARRGAFLEERGDRATAARLFAEAHQLVPEPAWALRAAEAELATGDAASAARRVEALVDQPGAEHLAVSAIVLRARALEASGRGREAVMLLEEEARRRPDADALFEAWVLALGEQDILLAQTMLREASRLSTERKLASVRLGLLAGADLSALRSELQSLASEWEAEHALDALGLALEVDRPELAREVVEAAVRGEWMRGGSELALDRAELALRSGDAARASSLLDVRVETPRHRARKASLQAAKFDAADERSESRAAWAEAARSIEPWEGETAFPLWRRVALRAAEDGDLAGALDVARRAHLLTEDGDLLEDAIAERARPGRDRAEWLQERAEASPPDRAAARWRQAAEAWDQEREPSRAEAARHELALRERGHSLALARWLEAEARWPELLEVLERRLGAGVEAHSEVESRLWVAKVALRLDQPEVARRHLEAARAVGGLDAEVLTAVREAAEQLGDEETVLLVLQEQGASASDAAARVAALLAVARLQAERGQPEAALDALTSAVGGEGGRDLRAWAEHAEAWALASNRADRAARAWAIHATTTDRPREVGVAFARTADIRWRELEDRRGALAAIDAAARKVPDDLNVTWMAIEMHGDLGDLSGLLRHARGAAERLPPGPAQAAFLLEAARHEGTTEAWMKALEAEPYREHILHHIAASDRMSPTAGLEEAIQARGWVLPKLPGAGERSELEGQETLRAELDLGGRWAELAQLEAARAETLDDPRARAEAWLGVAGLWGRIDEASARSEARLALERAVEADALWPRPLAEALDAATQDGDHDRARALVEELEALGGPAWIPARFERTAAEVTSGAARVRWLERAVERDPGHREALEVLSRTLADAGDHASALHRAEAWSASLDPHLEPEGVARCRRLRGELLLRMGRPEDALSVLDPADDEDAVLRVRALEASGAEPERRAEALEASYRSDGDVQHLIRAARLGVRLDALEALAAGLATPSEELEAVLVQARAEREEALALLGWVRRRGRRLADTLPEGTRWSVAREAFLRGDPALVAALLDNDEAGDGLDRVFEDAPLERFVGRLRPSEAPEARLLDRLAAYHRPYGAVARTWATSPVSAGATERLIDASRGWLLHDPTDARVLRTLLESLPREVRVAPEMARAWLEEGRERVAALEALGTGPRSVPTVARTVSYPGPEGRLRPAAEEPRLAELVGELEGDELVVVYDPEGGLRPRMRSDGALILGALLVQRATREELIFHCVRHRALEADAPAPSRTAWLACGSLAAAFRGLGRRMPYLPRWRSLEERQRFVLVDPEARDLLTFALVTPIRAKEERSAR